MLSFESICSFGVWRGWASLHIGFLFSDTVKTAAEKQREYRARRDADPARREKYLSNERERWRRDVEKGKKKKIGDLCEKAQRWRRKQWRESKERQKRRFFKFISIPNPVWWCCCNPEEDDRQTKSGSGRPGCMETHQGPYKGQNSLKNEVVSKATLRLHQMIRDQVNEPNNISVVTERERAGWDWFQCTHMCGPFLMNILLCIVCTIQLVTM